LLTDVTSEGQRMSYIPGSHKLKHHFTRYEDTRLTESQARGYGEVVECVGPAGTVVLFDANGIHRGNRNRGPRRDVVFGVYSAGRYLCGCEFNAEDVSQMTAWQKSILQRSQRASRGYASEGVGHRA